MTWEKEQLEEEKRVEQQHIAALHGSERAVEWRRAALVASPPEAGLSQAPPQKPEWTRGWGSLSQRRIVHGASHGKHYVGGTQRGAHGVVNIVDNSRNQCQRFEVLTEKGKQREEEEGEGEGPSKRPRVRLSSERMERRWMEVRDPQMRSQVVEALWALNAHLGEIQAELVTGWEAVSESVWLLRRSMIYNLHWIEMMLVV